MLPQKSSPGHHLADAAPHPMNSPSATGPPVGPSRAQYPYCMAAGPRDPEYCNTAQDRKDIFYNPKPGLPLVRAADLAAAAASPSTAASPAPVPSRFSRAAHWSPSARMTVSALPTPASAADLCGAGTRSIGRSSPLPKSPIRLGPRTTLRHLSSGAVCPWTNHAHAPSLTSSIVVPSGLQRVPLLFLSPYFYLRSRTINNYIGLDSRNLVATYPPFTCLSLRHFCNAITASPCFSLPAFTIFLVPSFHCLPFSCH